MSLGLAFGHSAVAQLPSGANVVAGSATIQQNGAVMTITQSSDKLATNWQSFSIGQGNTVKFVQPSASSVALNRVLGSDVSTIQGALNANGQVFLINPNGVIFTPSAQVNVGGLVASTLALSTEDFLKGNYSFGGSSGNAIVNQGNIKVIGDGANGGGQVALIAAKITNTGRIDAPRGQVLLGAGSAVTLDLGGPVKIQVTQGAIDALITQGGAIQADGGLIYLTAKAAGSLVSTVINHTGTSQAQTLVSGEQGAIYLMGGMDHDRIVVAGTLDASAPSAGTHGGFVETSAAQVSTVDGLKVSTLASQGGTSGTWLIDPYNYTIDSTAASTLATALGLGSVIITTDSDVAAYGSNGNSASSGNISVNSALTWGANTTLTLNAYNNIYVNANISATGSSGKLALKYGQGSTTGTIDSTAANYYVATGKSISLGAGSNFSTQLGSDTNNLKTYTVVTSLGAQGDQTVSAKYTLQGLANSGNLAGNYALGADIDATATSAWNLSSGVYQGFSSIGSSTTNFTGYFAGLGHTITGLTVNRSNNVGLFHTVGAAGVIRDVGLFSGAATATTTAFSANAGGLVGYNYGSISNAYNTGSVTVTNLSASNSNYTGGLVGYNSGSITNSYASGNVSSNGSYIGGLVGKTDGTITNSYATSNVTGAAGVSQRVGGLVGDSSTTISNNYATGVVKGWKYVGGLLGFSSTNASTSSFGYVTNSYATGAVNGVYTASTNDSARIGGLIGLAQGVSYSYSTGNVTGQSGQIGSLVGSTTTSIINSYASGSVNASTATSLYGPLGLVDSSSKVLTATQLKTSSNFNSWHFTNTWTTQNNNTAPLLRSFMTSLDLSSSVSQTYNGISYSITDFIGAAKGVTASLLLYAGTSQTLKNANSYTINPTQLYSTQQGYLISTSGTSSLTLHISKA
ncbi:hypothetical protein B9Z39_12735, partial [Limnohabitans sp. JirII-29]|uniref:two-partner secretion domain-containing protein n=1 Tax=Limnohabitans sp. JirII-29 TaxID=1835756 RepID=UPI000DD2A63A